MCTAVGGLMAVSIAPAGIITRPKSGTTVGTMLPQLAQKSVSYVRGGGSLYVRTRSLPRVQRKRSGAQNSVLANAVPRLRRHIEQWQWTRRVSSPATSKPTAPQRQLPTTVPGRALTGGRSTTGKSTPGGYAWNCVSASLIV